MIAVSDTVPKIIGGIPIRMRSIQVNIDKPNFMINPTNCSPFSVDSQGIGDQGTVTDFSSYFQAVNCATLPFKPQMTMKQLGERKQTRRRQATRRCSFDLRTRPGDANIKSVSVTLPNAFEIDQRHLGNICSEKELAADQCAGRQADRQGDDDHAAARPAAHRPRLRGVGLGGLPRLAFILNGQVNLMPRADIDDGQRRPSADHRPGRPGRPDRPLQPHRLRRQTGLPGQHPRPLQRAAR